MLAEGKSHTGQKVTWAVSFPKKFQASNLVIYNYFGRELCQILEVFRIIDPIRMRYDQNKRFMCTSHLQRNHIE